MKNTLRCLCCTLIDEKIDDFLASVATAVRECDLSCSFGIVTDVHEETTLEPVWVSVIPLDDVHLLVLLIHLVFSLFVLGVFPTRTTLLDCENNCKNYLENIHPRTA
jgi:hypothetical protein